MGNVYSFRSQFDIGKAGEARLDALFGEQYDITPATRDEERQGFDRWFTSASGARKKVEYKTDEQAANTGNLFLETMSVFNAETQKPGWLITSQADIFIYYAYGSGKAYWFDVQSVRRDIYELHSRYPTKLVRNRGYHSQGILIPVSDFVNKYVKYTLTVNERASDAA